MAGTFLRLVLLVLLCFSQLTIFMNAIPISRTRSLEQKSLGYGVLPANNQMANSNKKLNIMRRMDVELNDYPGSGANNRHTPRAQVARGCVDC